MQCMLDIAEKACEPDEEPLPLLRWEEPESVWLCCCPEPYKACKRHEMDTTCLQSVTRHLSKDKITTRSLFVQGLQMARGRMRKVGGEKCSSLASPKPLSVCGSEGAPKKSRSLDREDLFCEMVTWQWEELGDGNPEEFGRNGCVFDEAAQAGAGASSRKGGKLAEPEL
mmetsp:Transcript_6219/g.9638  ORF Transcript_6219/g.9638 Transcript_6219/m.9638 type:complete len:169 (-) Transcript_6219:65-571(-)